MILAPKMLTEVWLQQIKAELRRRGVETTEDGRYCVFPVEDNDRTREGR